MIEVVKEYLERMWRASIKIKIKICSTLIKVKIKCPPATWHASVAFAPSAARVQSLVSLQDRSERSVKP
ncbi:hypothetical protein E2C01_061187 [Portunus trituberculatus]|uniref:Uncharacterized protein n=1 Tax=Portunus trituberculatus TaxID=210409 RepID=A0A5B7HCI3_PORTR|nr:hypothetical protein [Portunus trituberculatus]